MSRAIRITGRPGSALDGEEKLLREPRLHTQTPDFESTVDDMPLLDGRLHRGAATTVTHAERNVP